MIQKSASLGHEQTEKRVLLSELLAIYRTYRDIEDSTVEQYQFVLDCFGRCLGREPLVSDLEPMAVNAWLASLRDTHSPHTVKSRRNTILSLWHIATELELAAAPRMIRRIKTPPRIVHRLSHDEIARIFIEAEALPGRYNGYLWRDLVRTWVQATLETALRPGDMRSLEWPDVVAACGRLTIVQQKTLVVRRLALSSRLMDDIHKWHSENGLVWPLGCRFIMGRKLSAIGEAANVRLTHTLLRQTSITDVEAQQPGAGWRFAGHSNPATTQTWYIDREDADRDIPRPRF